MEIEKVKTFLRASIVYACEGKLNLTNEQLKSLYEECIIMAGCLGDIRTQMHARASLTQIHINLFMFDEAIKFYETQLNIFKEIGERKIEGNVCGILGICYRFLGQYDKAVMYSEMSLGICKQVGDKKGEGCAYGRLSDCYLPLGQYHKVIEHSETQLNIAKQIGDNEGEGAAYGNLGAGYCGLGQYDKAKKHLEMSLNIGKQIGHKAIKGAAYGNLANCCFFIGQIDKAIENHEMQLNIAKQIGDKEMEGAAYCGLGACYCDLGQYEKAITHIEICLNNAKQVGDKAREGKAYGNLANCYFSLGQYDKAIKHHKMQLNIAKKIGDKAGERMFYVSVASCYLRLGQYDKAIKHIEICLNNAKKVGDKAAERISYGNLGSCYYSLGQYDKAIEHHEIELNIAKQIGDKSLEGHAYGGLATCYMALGQCHEAIRHHEIQLNIAKQIGDKAGEGSAYGGIGSCFYFLGQYDKAVKHLEIGLDNAKQIGDKVKEGLAYYYLGNCYCALGQYDTAEFNLQGTLCCCDELFKNTPKQDEMKISIRDTFVKCYKTLIDVLVLQGKANEALLIAERGRARALAELMYSSHFVECTEATKGYVLDLVGIQEVVRLMGSTVLFLALSNGGINRWIIQQNRCIVASAQTKVHSPNDGFISVAEQQLTTLICKFRKSRSTVKCEDRSLSFFYSETESQQRNKETTSRLFSARSSPKVEDPSSLPDFDEEMKQKGSTLTTSAAGSDCENLLKEQDESTRIIVLADLYQIILDPVRHLVEGTQLVVVPEGLLHLVPFSALMDEHGQYVAESLQVRLVPSLTTAKMIVENQLEPDPQGKPLIVGDPDAGPASRLPGANKEARMVAALFNSEALTGKEATKEKFLGSVEDANLIHIAAHGNMERGEILLAPNPSKTNKTTKPKKRDKVLKMLDLENKRLKARLVVLSCCHSAHGEIRAEGIVGIARSFLGAGARSVLVALWAIDDEATFYFMRKFYENLSHGKRAGESLNKAMADMRAHAPYSDPQHWAPFVLIGDDVTVC